MYSFCSISHAQALSEIHRFQVLRNFVRALIVNSFECATAIFGVVII